MSWTGFWKEKAQAAAQKRRRKYALDTPERIAGLLAGRVGFLGSLRLFLYVVFGSPRQWFRLWWAYLTDRDTPRRRRRIEGMAEALRARLSEDCRVLQGYFERRMYSRDLARVPRALERALHRTTPLLVAQPRTEQDVVDLLAFSREQRLPVYPRGVSSSAFGGAVPTKNGLVIDLSVMRRILVVDAEQRRVRLQPGVRWVDLATALAPYGLVPVTTPSSRFSTVGGWASTGGLGIDGFGYGPFSQALLSARVVFPDGSREVVEGSALKQLCGTEGQLGIITELQLRVRPKPAFSSSWLLIFNSAEDAFHFIDKLVDAGLSPSHVAFFDEERLREENQVMADRFGQAGSFLSEQDSLLLHFETRENERAFLDFQKDIGLGAIAPVRDAAYLWSERYFPLHAQRLGPSMLASEVVLPRRTVPAFIKRAKRMARRFGRPLSVEVFVARTNTPQDCVVIASFLCDARRRFRYLLQLLLVQQLTYLGIRNRGCPYGFGIWNSPFLSHRYNRAERKALVRRKIEVDPQLLLNPMKFFRVRTRLFNIPGFVFIGPVFAAGLGLARLFSPLLGLLVRGASPVAAQGWSVPKREVEAGKALLRQSALRCTFCGACVSSCPAYLLTGDELVTGRAKLRLAETLLIGKDVQPHEMAKPFLCLRCGLCEEVCQTRLPLRECYLALEEMLEKSHRRPTEQIDSFIEELEKNREWIQDTFGLDLPDWRVHP